MSQMTAFFRNCCRVSGGPAEQSPDQQRPVLVAHNGARYDFLVLAAECLRTGAALPDDWLFIDTLPLAKALALTDDSGRKLTSHNQAALLAHFGLLVPDVQHR